MVAPPAMSTFFPYTTLFRSERAAAEKLALQPAGHASSPSSVEMDTWVETSSDTRKEPAEPNVQPGNETDRKSTRLNSSHANISYAVFCLKKKNAIGAVTAAR